MRRKGPLVSFLTRTVDAKKFAPGKLTPELKCLARALRDAGWPGYLIAQEVKVSPSAVYRFLALDAKQPTKQER